MERRERDDGVTISALQLGLLRSYNHLIQPPGFPPPYPSYSTGILAEPQKGHGLLSKIELGPMLGAFQPYAALHFTTDPHQDLKAVSPLVSPILVGASGLCGRRTRGEKKAIPEEQKDERYFERRKRNNQAAKKSRDARKMREDQIALRATILEHENAMLRSQILTLRDETQALRRLLLLHNKGDPGGRKDRAVPRLATRSPSYRKDGFD